VTISDLVREVLNTYPTDKALKHIDDMADSLYAKLPDDIRAELDKYYPGASSYAKLSTMPDKWRYKTVGEFYQAFGTTIPDGVNSLAKYKDQKIEPLHFINMPYPSTYGCALPDGPNVVTALQDFMLNLEGALTHKSDQVMVTLVLTTHFVEDCHQPLHVINGVNKECVGDYGGNDFCLIAKPDGKCKDDLHYAWDLALFYFNYTETIPDNVAYINSNFGKYVNKTVEDNDIPERWAKEGYSYAEFIYNVTEYAGLLTAEYANKGRDIALERCAYAAYRLAHFLEFYIAHQ
jgi:hypothetical protein